MWMLCAMNLQKDSQTLLVGITKVPVAGGKKRMSRLQGL